MATRTRSCPHVILILIPNLVLNVLTSSCGDAVSAVVDRTVGTGVPSDESCDFAAGTVRSGVETAGYLGVLSGLLMLSGYLFLGSLGVLVMLAFTLATLLARVDCQ